MSLFLLVASAIGLMGCGKEGAPAPSPGGAGEGLPPVGDPGQVCAAYEEHPSVRSYCYYKLVIGLPTAEAMDAWCAEAGQWEGACRQAWVEGKLDPSSGVPTATLRGVCGTDADCMLDVLDHRHEPELLDQVAECQAWAGTNLSHCISHAVERWRVGEPSAATFAAVASAETGAPRWLGHFLAESVQCDGVGRCEDGVDPELVSACQAHVEGLSGAQGLCRPPRYIPTRSQRQRPGHRRPGRTPEGSARRPGTPPVPGRPAPE